MQHLNAHDKQVAREHRKQLLRSSVFAVSDRQVNAGSPRFENRVTSEMGTTSGQGASAVRLYSGCGDKKTNIQTQIPSVTAKVGDQQSLPHCCVGAILLECFMQNVANKRSKSNVNTMICRTKSRHAELEAFLKSITYS